jgi:hypothetical protein
MPAVILLAAMQDGIRRKNVPAARAVMPEREGSEGRSGLIENSA